MIARVRRWRQRRRLRRAPQYAPPLPCSHVHMIGTPYDWELYEDERRRR